MYIILSCLLLGGLISISLYLETKKTELLVIGTIVVLLVIAFINFFTKWKH
jgi:hypothetical protein